MDPAIESVQKDVDALYAIRDQFPADPKAKQEQLLQGTERVLEKLRAIDADVKSGARPTNVTDRALRQYLEGRALDVCPEYNKQAEDCLAKAVKLNPSMVDAWNCLGHAYWKKGDLTSAANCFKGALAKEVNAASLRHLSMLERCMAKGQKGNKAEEAQLVDLSLQHAKEAVALDVRSGESWYTLANAYSSHFFVRGAPQGEELSLAIKAYRNAERDPKMLSNPDLHFNRAVVHQFLEEYESALEGFSRGVSLDPALRASDPSGEILRLLAKLEEMCNNNARLKPKKMATMVASLTSPDNKLVTPPAGFTACTLATLAAGSTPGTPLPAFSKLALACKVTVEVPYSGSVPLYFVAVDSTGICFALSLYAVRPGVIRDGDMLLLLQPEYHNVSVAWQEHKHSFPCLRVYSHSKMLVNGKPISSENVVHSVLHLDNPAL
eukprot:jgi/Mesvir1/4543/Mv12437-RA.1